MTTAQDQQSRAEFEAIYRSEAFQAGITYGSSKEVAYAVWQAARALPAPENVREGESYDNPAFEDLARTMSVWGTAQAALCAQFFLAGRGAAPATASVSNAGCGDQWKCGNEFLPYHPSASHVEPAYRDGWNACYKAAAQVLAMGRVPAMAVPITASIMRDDGGERLAYCVMAAYRSEADAVAALDALAASPRPPAVPATCGATGVMSQAQPAMYGAGSATTGAQAVITGAGGVTTEATQEPGQ